MSTFPSIRSGAVEVFYPLDGDVEISYPRLQDFLKANLMETAVPHDWDTLDADDERPSEKIERIGYFFPDDAENLLVTHRYYAFGIRRWAKSVPASTLNAAARQRRREMIAEAAEQGTVLDADSLKLAVETYKNSLERELLRRAVPKLEEDVVVWDDEHKRLLIFAAGGPKRDRLRTWAYKALEAASDGDMPPLVRWTLEGSIKRARPNANPPGEVGKRFWAWLMWHAHRGPRTIALPSFKAQNKEVQPVTRYVRVEVDERLILKPGDGTRRFEGDAVMSELNDTISTLDEPEELYDVHSVDLVLGTPEHQDDPVVRWEVRVRGDGTLSTVNLCAPTDRDNSGDYDAWALIRADAFFAAHDAWNLLVQAYDAGPLTELLLEQPQGYLWPIRTRQPGTWIAMSDLPPDPDVAEADDAQQRLT